ncbi:MAG: hypothetical protein COB98_01260 [Flavobacteriaceae bacterium]|nr:MAG: hypothetical protein COB98_01260 [Flavobacteriaceae bacterium]
MKKMIFPVVALMSISLLFSCKQESALAKVKTENVAKAEARDEKISEGIPVIEFDQRAYEFGTVDEGDIIEGVFKITNKGTSDLVILSAKASCGCTVPSWPKTPIKPGDTAELSFKFNTRGKPNKQNKSITIKSNAEKTTEVLRIKGFVTPKPKKAVKK